MEFLDMMRRTNLTAASTYFQPRRHKSNATYLAKDPEYKPSQIDYVLNKSVSEAASAVLPKRTSRPLRKRVVSTRTKNIYAHRQNNFQNMNSQQRKVLSGKTNSTVTMPSKDLAGEPIVSSGQLLSAWNAFLAQKFATPPADSHRQRETTVSQEDHLSDSELEECLKALKSGKAPGHAYKLLSAVIARRLHIQLEPLIPDSQAGFRPAREFSEPFEILRGVLQGDIFSPVAFIIGPMRIFALHDIPNSGVTVGSPPYQVTISRLEYADDAGLQLTSGSKDDAAMEISVPKTKAMHIHSKERVSKTTEAECLHHPSTANTRSRTGTLADKEVQRQKRLAKEKKRPHLTLQGQQLENVHAFDYFGSRMQCDGDQEADVNYRMAIAQTRFSSLQHIWRDHRLPNSLKVRLYKSSVCSTLTHSCEAWDLTRDVTRMINGFNSRCLQVITKKHFQDTATNPDHNLMLTIRRRRLRYIGHILRMDPSRLVRRTLEAYVCGGDIPPEGSLLMDCEPLSFEHGQSAGQGTVSDGDRVRWGPGAVRPVGGRRDEPTPKDELHRLWRDNVGIRPRYAERGAPASRSLTPDIDRRIMIGHGKLRQVHPEMQTTAEFTTPSCGRIGVCMQEK
ncbi:hypothetical protein Bbelb_053610 [Branchiostoma belcheri]|nr:hypothetical protein Bbelb_053610 [Branchiostoma belcheri]